MFSSEDGLWHISGDPTEAAVLVFGQKIGFHKEELNKQYPKLEDNAFNYQKKYRSSLHNINGKKELIVDHVTDRATGRHLPQAGALAETIRRRRVGGAAQKTFAGLVGLELRPRRLRDAANLWAALENAGGSDLRDGRWSHPDLAPTSTDLDDIIGYVDRASGKAPVDEPLTGLEGLPDDLGADLDSVLRGILDEANPTQDSATTDAPTNDDPTNDTPGDNPDR